MESPRSSLFSTVIMTLPLVVVPAIALLRPPAPSAGLSSSDLSADEDDDFFSQLDQFEPGYKSEAKSSGTDSVSPSSDDEIVQWLESDSSATTQQNAPDPFAESGVTPGASADPFLIADDTVHAASTASPKERAVTETPVAALPSGTPPVAPAHDGDEVPLLQQLHSMGVTRTMWFTPGTTGNVGFAAFVPGEATAVVYRFESVAGTRREALLDVALQISRWRANQNSVQAPQP